MAYYKEKHASEVYSSAASPSDRPYLTNSRKSGFSIPDMEKRDLKIKKRIRVFRAISRAIALIASGYMLGTLAYALSKYFLTKNHVVSGTPYWPMPTKLWPTYMLLAIAATTVSMNLITLSAYACGIGAANKTGSVFGIIGIIFSASEIVAWAISAGLFRMAQTGNDLWGYSCLDSTDALAAEIQAQRKSFVNFGQLCNMQGGAWYASIIQAGTYLLTFITVILMMRRASHKKNLARARQNSGLEAGYTQNVEMGNVYKPANGKKYIPVSAESRF